MTSPRHPLSDILSHIPQSASVSADLSGESFQSFEGGEEIIRNTGVSHLNNAHERTEGIGDCVVISFEAVKRHRFTVGAAGGRFGGNGSRDAAAPAASLRKHQNVAAGAEAPVPAVSGGRDRWRSGPDFPSSGFFTG